MVAYGIYLLVLFTKASSGDGGGEDLPLPPNPYEPHLLKLGRPMLLLVSLSENIIDKLPKAWFLYLFIGVGAIVFVISCCGCIGVLARSGCCLSCYAFLVVVLILVELGCAAFIFFNEDWEDFIPKDKTGNFEKIYDFLDDNWDFIRWAALGIVTLQAIVFLLALIVRATNMPADYDSDDEYFPPRPSFQHPLIERQYPAVTGAPVASNIEQRSIRNDAWSTRMREKYGLDTSEFTYNPSDPNNRQQTATTPDEGRGGCSIL